MIEIVYMKEYCQWVVRFIGVDYERFNYIPDNDLSALYLSEDWESEYKRITEEYRVQCFRIDRYIHDNPEEFKQLFNKAKVKYLL